MVGVLVLQLRRDSASVRPERLGHKPYKVLTFLAVVGLREVGPDAD